MIVAGLSSPESRVAAASLAAIRDVGGEAYAALPVIEAMLRTNPDNARELAVLIQNVSMDAAKNSIVASADHLARSARVLRELGFDQESDRVQIDADLLTEKSERRLMAFIEGHTKSLSIVVGICAYVLWIIVGSRLTAAVVPWLFVPEDRSRIADRFTFSILGFTANLGDFTGWKRARSNPLVLDRWVERYRKTAIAKVEAAPPFSLRQYWHPLPVIMEGQPIPAFNVASAQEMASSKTWLLAISGDGGVGKTTLACYLARSALHEHAEQRLCVDHPMIPVVIDPSAGTDAVSGPDRLKDVIRSKLGRSCGLSYGIEASFCEELLRQQRILVVVDGLSEMKSDGWGALLESSDLGANAIIVTSRSTNGLNESHNVQLGLLGGIEASEFFSGALRRKLPAGVKASTSFLEKALSIVFNLASAAPGVTPLFVELLAQRASQAVQDGDDAESLPASIPQLVGQYLSFVNRNAGEDDLENYVVNKAARVVAWACVRRTFRPGMASKEDVLDQLDIHGVPVRALRYLEHRLNVVRSAEADESGVVFVFDPICEYLAALHMAQTFTEDGWRSWLAEVDHVSDSPRSVKGLLIAVRDCASEDDSRSVPSFVQDEVSAMVESAEGEA